MNCSVNDKGIDICLFRQEAAATLHVGLDGRRLCRRLVETTSICKSTMLRLVFLCQMVSRQCFFISSPVSAQHGLTQTWRGLKGRLCKVGRVVTPECSQLGWTPRAGKADCNELENCKLQQSMKLDRENWTGAPTCYVLLAQVQRNAVLLKANKLRSGRSMVELRSLPGANPPRRAVVRNEKQGGAGSSEVLWVVDL